METKKSTNYLNPKDDQKIFSFEDDTVKKSKRRRNVKTEQETLIDDDLTASSFEVSKKHFSLRWKSMMRWIFIFQCHRIFS